MPRKVHILALETPGGGARLDAETRAAALRLVEAARDGGLHVGWLSFEDPTVPASLNECGAAGALRSVQVGARGSLTWKPRSGPPVLEDLLREHCAGCRVVFLEGRTAALALRWVADDVWRLRSGGRTIELDGARLVARLRRPRLLDE